MPSNQQNQQIMESSFGPFWHTKCWNS